MTTSTDNLTIHHPITVGSEEFNANQHRYYEWMRRHAPVYRGRLKFVEERDVYFVSRHHDCLNLVTDPRIRRHVAGAQPLPLPKAIRMLTTDTMIYKDDPEHLRLRKLVSHSFTPRTISHLEARVESVTRGLLDQMTSGQEIDLQQAYALPVPTTVINELVGVPENDRYRFRDFVEIMLDGVNCTT
ncbi:cytochrome P450 [Mycobacterium decipiens]|uniref:Cytochrome P450 n=1 Tax=Mycobacterium decipiens TaxID=1430326 RepID=A0A1X2LPD0_9MYCO|nr:cytochrome P450 [Mycobacterium decipiens]OSC37219.1 hypothetical protein B8W66_21775 [Mycobacterium decipiens]